jgi:hypothetical protein
MNFVSPIIAFICMLAAGAVCVFLYTDVVESAVTIKESRDQIAEVSARDTFAKSAAQFLAETSAERSAVQFFILPVEGTAQAIELVEQAGKVAGVKAEIGSAVLVPLSDPRHERLDITVSAESTFAGAARFGTVLESLPKGAYVTSVNLSATDKGWFGTYVVSFIKQK